MRNLLTRFARVLSQPRVIYDREGGTPYLSRWYLLGKPRDPDPEFAGQLQEGARDWRQRLPVNLFLHRFHRSDDDEALHNHPWAWAVSLVLAGGYDEERRVGDEVVRRRFRPWALNFLTGQTYHRVELLESDAWSLFVVGPKRSTWYFWDRNRNARCQWRQYIAALRNRRDVPWEPDEREAAS